ncbi:MULTISPECIES: PrsW family glutamic-type intramembrane protease [Nostocales]|uniref:PrsW family intramembrane metalloprotease n=3 Tax=Nostocales TaxID=1161 RepID=A0A8S9SX36_9CYAN|nr:PrsW family intramembrane metalloprotease [Tolypothrix bouteillei VB521301]
MTKNFQIQLSWKDPVTGEQREPRLSLPIALGREFSQMPVEHNGKRVARMLLKSHQVSRYHALIDCEQNHLVVIDRNSANGTFVNSQRQTRCILTSGDILQIGSCTITVSFDSREFLQEPNDSVSIDSHEFLQELSDSVSIDSHEFPQESSDSLSIDSHEFPQESSDSLSIDSHEFSQESSDSVSLNSHEFPQEFTNNKTSISSLHIPTAHSLSLTEIFPVISNKLDLYQSGFLIPGLITVLFVVGMLATRNSDKFFYILAAYLAISSHYFIHKICHKHKPWWLLFSVGLATALPLLGGLHLFSSHHDDNFFEIIVKTFLGQGLSEELFKAFPVFLVYLIGRLLSSPKRESIGIWEPIDGILLGTASATGFALVETMMHVHEEIEKSGHFAGLTLLIPQILGDISGQVAYSGYFGYFIGLSTLKKSWRWQLLGIGCMTTATIHAIGSIVTTLQEKQQHKYLASISLVIIGSLAYAFLIAAILKARQLSPKLQKSISH